jgi:hypothetical protein
VTRIRYTLTDGMYISRPAYTRDGKEVVASYNPTTYEYYLVNRATGTTLDSGTGKDNHSVKKRIKLCLRKHGVVFSDEIRRRED